MASLKTYPSALDIMATNGRIFDGIVPHAGTCPDCGGVLTIDLRARRGYSDDRAPLTSCRVAYCNGCEFITEV